MMSGIQRNTLQQESLFSALSPFAADAKIPTEISA